MVIDTSAFLAILLREPDWRVVMQAVLADSIRLMSAVSRLESVMVTEGRKPGQAAELENLIEYLRIEVVGFDENQLAFAINAFRRYGKGRHPAALNLGDCCAYGLAKALNEPLLFKGADFSRTDIASAATG
jgi:ribonuclease VapC